MKLSLSLGQSWPPPLHRLLKNHFNSPTRFAPLRILCVKLSMKLKLELILFGVARAAEDKLVSLDLDFFILDVWDNDAEEKLLVSLCPLAIW